MYKSFKTFIRKVINKILHLFGLLTYQLRQKPDFLIIGAQKGGTSSLFFYLKFHPQIQRPIKKEIHYFNLFFDRGEGWYLAHFPFRSTKHLTGEASPDYMFHPDSPERIHSFNPNMKFILLLRDPIERAYSAYQMNKRMGIDTRETFEDAIQYEFDNREQYAKTYNYEKHNFFYLERGLYAQQIARWTKVFDKNKFLVIKSSDFFSNTNDVLKHVYNFLDIEVKLPPTLKPMNVGKYPPISSKIRENLESYYSNDAIELKKNWQIEF